MIRPLLRGATAALFPLITAIPAAPFVDATLKLSSYDSGATFTNMHSGAAGTVSEYVVGFELTVASVNGDAGFASPIAAFCTEQAESISPNSTHRFDLVPLEHVAAGRAGEAGTASLLIPEGGIGELRAARVRYLFDQYYQSSSMSAWTGGAAAFESFQLAVWEVTHDTNLDLQTPSANGIYVVAQNNTARDAVIAQAQSMLDNVTAANVTLEYQSARIEVWGLVATGIQDLLLGVPLEMEEEVSQLSALVPSTVVVPEPATALLLGLCGLLLLRRRTGN